MRNTFPNIENRKPKSLCSHNIGKNNDLFGIKIAKELLINIISFLSCEYTCICKRICKTWFDNLKSDLSKKKLTQIPKKMCYLKSYKVDFIPRSIARIENHICISNELNMCEFDIKKSGIIRGENKFLKKNLISSNGNYICSANFHQEYVYIFSLKIELINTIKINGIVCGFLIDDYNKILISACDKFYIYNLKGNMINSWDLENNLQSMQISRKIAISKGEIYMVDTNFYRICVFSYDGQLIRSWGKLGSQSGYFKFPWGITIYQGIIFVVDSRNNRIQVFTRYGKFILEEKYKDGSDMGDIIIMNDYVYVNDWVGACLIKFKLIYN